MNRRKEAEKDLSNRVLKENSNENLKKKKK